MPEDSQDGGLLGWRNWKLPKPFYGGTWDLTPSSVDGSYSDDMNFPNRPTNTFTANNPLVYPNRSIAWDLQMRYVNPGMKNFITDMSAAALNCQGKPCEDFEMNAMECIEYYGMKQGLEACKDWYDDYLECVYQTKQKLRVMHMFRVRHKENWIEYLQGKRSKESLYEPTPKMHAYMAPWVEEKYQSAMHGTMM